MSASGINIIVRVDIDPLFRLQTPRTGDTEQMLADMRTVEPLRRDALDNTFERLRQGIVKQMSEAMGLTYDQLVGRYHRPGGFSAARLHLYHDREMEGRKGRFASGGYVDPRK